MAPVLSAHAQALDPSFANGGQFTLQLAGASSQSSRMIRDANGNSFIAGFTPGLPSNVQATDTNNGTIYFYVPTDASRDMFIAKIAPTGELDRSFSGDGIATIDFNGRDDRAIALVQQADGKLIVIGSAEVAAGQFDLAIARLRADGTLDPSFNGTGKFTVDLGGSDDVAADVKLLSNGTLLIAGNSGALATETTSPGFIRPVVAKLRSNGSLDATFDGDGLVTLVLPASTQARSLLLDQDGKIMLVGWSDGPTAVLVRLSATGALDPTFGNAGVRTFDSLAQGWPAAPFSALPTADGSFLVAGFGIRASFSPPFATFVARFGAGGVPDAAFGAGGTAMDFIPRDYNYATDIALEPNGKILLGGAASRGDQYGPSDPYLARLMPDGSLDETFGDQGVMLVPRTDASLTSLTQSLSRGVNGRLQLSGVQGEYTSVPGLLGGEMVAQTKRAFAIQLTSTPTFGFAASTASVNESQGSVELTVSRIGTTTGTVSVHYSTVPIGNAVGFTPASGTLSWSPGDPQSKTISVGIVSDSIDRPNQQFKVVLSEPSEGSTAAVESAVVTVVDDDEPSSGGGGGGGGSLDFGWLSLLAAFLVRSRRRASAYT